MRKCCVLIVEITPKNDSAYAAFYSRRIYAKPRHHSVSEAVCAYV